ncbi:MAG: ribosome maturation factor RimM [Clostridia bacterium]|nr:ribosome maturation factor RimM [Clostridia bacterium]
MENKYLECALICSTHGVRGGMRLENRCDTPQVLASLERMYIKEGDGYRELRKQSSFIQKSMVVCTFEGIDTVEQAAALRGTVLYAKREDFHLKEGEFFIADMIGLPVIDAETGDVLGKLKNVIKPGAQQIYVVERDGREFMIPAVPEFVKDISLEKGITVKTIEGLLDI